MTVDDVTVDDIQHHKNGIRDIRMQLVHIIIQLLGKCSVLEKGVPHRTEDSTTVKGGGLPILMVVEGFESPSSQVVGLHLLHCGYPPSPPCAAWSLQVLRSHSSRCVSSLLFCAHLVSSPVFFQFPNADTLTLIHGT